MWCVFHSLTATGHQIRRTLSNPDFARPICVWRRVWLVFTGDVASEAAGFDARGSMLWSRSGIFALSSQCQLKFKRDFQQLLLIYSHFGFDSLQKFWSLPKPQSAAENKSSEDIENKAT